MHSFFKKERQIKVWGRKNHSRAQFRIGQRVKIIDAPAHYKQFVGRIVKIRAMNFTDPDNGFEYIVTEYPLLLWEDELEGV